MIGRLLMCACVSWVKAQTVLPCWQILSGHGQIIEHEIEYEAGMGRPAGGVDLREIKATKENPSLHINSSCCPTTPRSSEIACQGTAGAS